MKNIFGKISQRRNGYFEKFIYYGEVYILGSMAEDGWNTHSWESTRLYMFTSRKMQTRKNIHMHFSSFLGICCSSVTSCLIWNILSRVPKCTSWSEKSFMDFIELSLVANRQTLPQKVNSRIIHVLYLNFEISKVFQ